MISILNYEIDREKIGITGIDKISFTVVVSDPGVDISAAIEESDELKTRTINIEKRVKEFTGPAAVDSGKIGYSLYNQQENKKQVLKLDIVAGRILHNTEHNVYVAPVKEIKRIVKSVLNELKAAGIIIPFDSLKLTSIEINKTIETELSLSEYEDAIKYMFKNRFKHDNRDNNDSCTIVSGDTKNRITLKFYDKAAQIKNDLDIQPDCNLIRFEITIARDQIKRSFQTNDIRKISQKDINTVFKKELDKLESELIDSIIGDSLKLYRFFITNEVSGVSKIDQAYKDFNNNKMTSSGLIIPFYEIAYIAIRNLYRDNNKSNFTRDAKKVVGVAISPLYTNLKNVLLLLYNLVPGGRNVNVLKKAEKKVSQLLHTNFS